MITPYGYETYDEYFDILRIYAEKHKGTGLERRLLDLIDETRALNVKEEWSVVRYLGSDLDDDPDSLASNLTKGRCYYWPCSAKDPRYNGVIDDEEFTSYLYPCDKECWEVLADPTGMAQRALDGEADTLNSWILEFDGNTALRSTEAESMAAIVAPWD